MPPSGDLANHDLSEFFRRGEPALRAHRVGELLPWWNRFAAHLSGGIDGVLRLDRGDDLGDRDAQLGQLVRLDPQPHGVLARAEHLDRADPRRRASIGSTRLM